MVGAQNKEYAFTMITINENLKNSFIAKMRDEIIGRNILVLDDVVRRFYNFYDLSFRVRSKI